MGSRPYSEANAGASSNHGQWPQVMCEFIQHHNVTKKSDVFLWAHFPRDTRSQWPQS